MLPKTRLGKRSPLGTLVTCPPPGNQTGQETETGITVATGISRFRGHPGLKVYFQCGGAGEALGVDQKDSLHIWSGPSSSSAPTFCSRSVSSCIDVPRSQRSPEEVDVDELMAAMVLSSLSCSPVLKSPAPQDTTAPMDGSGGGGELSDSSSGYWSVGHGNGSPVPSPPEPALSPAPPPDEGLDMELDQVLFDEPAPRKRKNSVKVVYRCLWPSCGKVLTTVAWIKRHIRMTHLCRGSEHERCSRSEEDFYYTEINQRDEPQATPPPVVRDVSPSPSVSPSSPPSPPPPSPPSPPSPTCSALSRSAPSSSSSVWQVQSEHSYQAPPLHHGTSAAVDTPPCPVKAPPTSCLKHGLAFRVRSVSVGEQWLQQHSAPCRRIRGEAKKCRKVYGIEHREQWCTACRWKKACQRFLD